MTSRVHGGLQGEEAARYGRELNEFLDFSASLNPFGPPPGVIEAARNADLTRYPSPDAGELRQELASRLSVTPREVLVGNGSSEIFYLLARAFANGRPGLVFTPAFGEYSTALQSAGAEIIECRADANSGFSWPIDDALATIAARRPALVFLGSPNNPTGAYLARDEVRRIAAALTDSVLVLDEAYVSFVDEPWRSNRLAPNVAVVRSFTKDFAIPGLRLGYMVAPRRIVEAAAAQQPSWSVGAPALAAGLACLGERAWLDDTTSQTREAKRDLVEMLTNARLDVHVGAANFVLVRVDEVSKVRRALLERGLVVRDCTSFGLPGHVRIGVRQNLENRRLVEALVEALA
jgi:L-threonine-O-3-phosphate decarboxylase